MNIQTDDGDGETWKKVEVRAEGEKEGMITTLPNLFEKAARKFFFDRL